MTDCLSYGILIFTLKSDYLYKEHRKNSIMIRNGRKCLYLCWLCLKCWLDKVRCFRNESSNLSSLLDLMIFGLFWTLCCQGVWCLVWFSLRCNAYYQIACNDIYKKRFFSRNIVQRALWRLPQTLKHFISHLMMKTWLHVINWCCCRWCYM